ncbi:MAG: hypothetical protein PF485_05360 [Bacteroidales bacterium]|jgi:hypothetical protein|nr:hypothetical protein [Bacteroidales bacterium]
MKKSVSLLLFACIYLNTFLAFSQLDEEIPGYEISIDYGIFNSLNSSIHENLTGNKLSFQVAIFSLSDFGFRTGISSFTNLEGSDKFYTIPLCITYRTGIYRRSNVVGSLTDLILVFMPMQAEFNFGTNIGYIEPDNNLGLSSINGGPWIQRGYQAEQRFVSTIDLGLRFNYKIKRISIVLSPIESYILSQNFKYYSEDEFDNGYTPQWFLSFTFGVSYQF